MLVLYGAPKVGKTTFLSTLPNNFIIDLEEGTEMITALKVNANSLTELREVIALLRAAKANPALPQYDYVTLDTVSKLEEWCEGYATEMYKASTVGVNFTGASVLTLPKGAGYLWLRLAIQEILQELGQVSRTLILAGHLRDKDLEKPGFEVAAKDIDLTGKIRNIVCSRADAIGYMYRKTNKPMMISFAATDEVNCGSRCEHLKGQQIEPKWENIFLPTPAST